jgi:3-deoxy-D-manno-octulosonate 8-phosphate phosphatase (KDO 8-P phosphatase)
LGVIKLEGHDTALVKAAAIRLLILDVDGVLTDGGIVFDDMGREIKVFNVRDGHGIKLLREAGLSVAIITGRTSEVVTKRAKELGIDYLFQGVKNKAEAYGELKSKTNFSDSEIACIGDDINDLPLFKRAALPVAVSDAAEELKKHALYITERPGGRGAVREVCELILRAQGKWRGIIDAYLQP